jgi:hypothetical protein
VTLRLIRRQVGCSGESEVRGLSAGVLKEESEVRQGSRMAREECHTLSIHKGFYT